MTREAKATGLMGPEVRGVTGDFSASNLWRMKGFFETYRDAVKLAPLAREIGWSHNIVIMERCSGPLEREFYLRMTPTTRCTIAGPENLNAEAVRLAAVIKRNFEELGV